MSSSLFVGTTDSINAFPAVERHPARHAARSKGSVADAPLAGAFNALSGCASISYGTSRRSLYVRYHTFGRIFLSPRHEKVFAYIPHTIKDDDIIFDIRWGGGVPS
jgi:hypothetical protein